MSWHSELDPVLGDKKSCQVIETIIVPRTADLGGFSVRRALPSIEKRMVGPFIFFDQMGPAEFLTGQGLDVRPHPHIGLATVTYLFEGQILHRDSLGTTQIITPGAVNIMSAGSGIVHSERTPQEQRRHNQSLFGLQAWVALPKEKEESPPQFTHYADHTLPIIEQEGKTLRLIMGQGWGLTSPVKVEWETLYADVTLEQGASLPLDADSEERAVWIAKGSIEIAGDTFEAGRLLVFKPGDKITMKATSPSKILILGGTAMEGPRYIWWNFVSSSKDRINQARNDWAQGRFGKVETDPDLIPLPETPAS